MSGRKFKRRGSLAATPKRGRVWSGDPRKYRRGLRRMGVRVNPTARRASFIVKVKNRSGGLIEQGLFRSQPVAIDYARALARKYPRLTIAVYKQ